MNKLFLFSFCCFCMACNVTEDKIPEKEEIPVTIVGKWVCTSLDYVFNNNDETILHGSRVGPFTGQADLVEYVRFTNDSLYIKMGGQMEVDIKPVKYFYNATQKIILIADSIETDTLFHVSGLTVDEIYFYYTERDTLNNKIQTNDYRYTAEKQ